MVALVRAGADPLLRDKEGLTCVMVAAAFEHKRVLAYLLAKLGACVRERERTRQGPSSKLRA